MRFISRDNFARFLNALSAEYDVFVPVKKGEQRFYERYNSFTDDVVVGEVRAFEPLKSFFMRAREVVAEDFENSIPSKGKPLAIVGAKACDLKGFKVQDSVFQGRDYQDPFYIKARRENLIISSDCTCAIETCFCLALGLRPYPQENFDLNLSPLSGGFLIESGSDKGQILINKYSSLFEGTNQTMASQRQQNRKQVVRAVEKNIKQNAIPSEEQYKGMIERNFESKIWREEARTCVECGACNTVCPTCHCFLLYDQNDQARMERLRIWDSCMIKDFARVAGGANPRPHLWMRLRNRFEKKFDFFPKTADIYACTGCGRCISACPGKIDIRKVLKRLVDNG